MKISKKILVVLGFATLYTSAGYAWKTTLINKTNSTLQLQVEHDAFSTSKVELKSGATQVINNPGISCVSFINLKAVGGDLDAYTARYPGQRCCGGVICGNTTYTFSPDTDSKGEKFINYSYKQ
jgi:hypothetical protein